ncbi:hypothetical protein RBG61_04245 [Paludicola sp. MB14-C6]|uniref:hypothetical protein n=1 Tax=Paludihabitans sp. MB14-C6 TaxID=3070656 RepID=UPI0027DCBCFC|nr:hypothetical protein [Paludicola sp. MB14-C6]WMJ23885.1 hypothetical protein RBG61_04245 [Paludicola sp. MB14-C6]
MKRMKRMLPIIYFSILTFIMVTPSVNAYLDAATTSYIIQVVAGVFIALGTVIGIFWKKITSFFKKLKIKAMEKKISKDAEKKSNNA